jgi:hypothetical protein
MRLVIKNSIQLCLRTLVFSIVLRHSNYNNRIVSIEGTFLGTPCIYFKHSLSLLANHVNHNMSREEALYLIKLIFISILYIKVHPN